MAAAQEVKALMSRMSRLEAQTKVSDLRIADLEEQLSKIRSTPKASVTPSACFSCWELLTRRLEEARKREQRLEQEAAARQQRRKQLQWRHAVKDALSGPRVAGDLRISSVFLGVPSFFLCFSLVFLCF